MKSKKTSIALLGSTGSIGVSSLSVIKKHQNSFSVNLLACNKNKLKILKQIKFFLPSYVIIKNNECYNFVKKKKFKKKILLFRNIQDFNNFCKKKKIKFDKVILGISSIAGLEYAMSFISKTKEMLIANKESIVCGGKFFLNSAKKLGCKIISVDSEHFCIANSIKNLDKNLIDKIYLTASGGPFLNKKVSEISRVEPKLALKHPKWKMGKKISIDSATMANKGLEIIEASYLFNLRPDQIKVKIHKESKVHSVIILKNGLIYLTAHDTSMKIPLENSLLNYKKVSEKKTFFIKKNTFSFSFDEINLKKFIMISLAYKALKLGQRACIFYNVINDFLVEKYLKKKIFFYEISSILNNVISNKKFKYYFKKKIKKISDIYETIAYAKIICKDF